MSKVIFVSLSLISASLASIVEWLPDRSFNLPLNFQNERLPCSKEIVVFPDTLQESVTIENDSSAKEFILPIEGEIILAEGSIVFGEDPRDTQCNSDGYIHYIEDSVVSWAQPNAWSSDRFNEATPDAERIPCYDDVVVFPEKAQFSIELPFPQQIVKGLIVSRKSLSMLEFIVLLYHNPQESQHFIRSEKGMEVVIRDKKCKLLAGCPCQATSVHIECGTKFCPEPMCVNPIKPEGHCCYICGGFIVFDIDEDFNMLSFKDFVAKIVESFDSDKLAYHIGRLPSTGITYDDYEALHFIPGKVQVVVVDKGEYTGTSAEVVNEIRYRLNVKGNSKALMSGSPLNKSGLGGKIFISMFFLVALVMGGIYFYYYKVPNAWMRNISINMPGFGMPNLSRFQRSDSVVTLTRRDSTISGVGGGAAFRNPLYDSRRGRVQVVEPIETLQEE